MDLNKKICFKCPVNEIISDETEDEGTVDVEEFWESVEDNILARIFPNRVMQKLKIKSCFNYWAACIGKYTRRSKIVLNAVY